jgi:hypothetical protein
LPKGLKGSKGLSRQKAVIAKEKTAQPEQPTQPQKTYSLRQLQRQQQAQERQAKMQRILAAARTAQSGQPVQSRFGTQMSGVRPIAPNIKYGSNPNIFMSAVNAAAMRLKS